MKKTISLTLVLIMLLSSLCSCNGKKPDESDKSIDNNDNNYNQNIEDDNGGENDDSENDDGENDDANGQKTDPSKLTYEDQPVAVAKDKHGNYYAYVKEWNAYYLMPNEFVYTHITYHPYCYPIVHDNVNVAWLLTLESPSNKSEGYKLSVYKFSRGSETVETYTHICEPKEGGYGKLYEVFYDFYDENHGYIFFWDENDFLYRDSTTEKTYLRTDDGGKTWYAPECDKHATTKMSKETTMIAKFVSNDVGIISYKYYINPDLSDRTYITANGGKTWELISALPYPEQFVRYYSEVINFEYVDGKYLLNVKIVENRDPYYCQFSSSDLKSWKLVKQANISEIVEAYKFILKDNTYIHLPSYNGIALADLDQDGIAEIVLRASDEFIILHYFAGQAYPHSLSRRVGITKGGTCRWSIQAGRERGMDRIQFNGKNLVYVDETRITKNAEYYLNGVPTTLEKIQSIAWCNEPIRFSEFNKDNVELLITVDGIINKSLICNCNNSNDDNHNQNIEDATGTYDGYLDIINPYKDLILYKDGGNDVTTFDLSGYANISSEVSSALKQIVFNNRHQLLGYAFKDINNDGTTELVLLDRDYNIFALFTSINKKAVLLDTFGVANNTGAIDKDGRIYKNGYSKGETDYEKIMILTASGELKEEIKYGRSDMVDGQAPRYYKYVSGEKHDITKAEYDELGAQYSSIFSDTAKVTKESGIAFNEIMEFDPK